ncbi:MAG: hypothetical protein H6R17_2853 [Proteobacteria bacterium]|nr:hypothetical protein [Pseudomonadota bacterium]
MKLKVFKGKIKAMGESSAPVATMPVPITTYSYIKMSDGQRIDKLVAEAGLNDKLKGAALADQDVELHVVLHAGGTAGLIAIKVGDAGIFATKSTEVPASKRKWKKAGLIIGVLLVPLMGVGLIILWRTWELSKAIASHDEVRDYVASLPNATLI